MPPLMGGRNTSGQLISAMCFILDVAAEVCLITISDILYSFGQGKLICQGILKTDV